MGRYILRRLVLIPVTLLGILLITFTIAQFAPGGPQIAPAGAGLPTPRLAGQARHWYTALPRSMPRGSPMSELLMRFIT